MIGSRVEREERGDACGVGLVFCNRFWYNIVKM